MRTSSDVLGVCLLLLACGCVSLKIPALLPPENQVESICVCSGIDASGELLDPLDVRDEFPPNIKKVFCHIRVLEISRTVKLRWRWYDPKGRLHRETDDVLVNREEKFLEVLTAYDGLDLAGGGEVRGEWTVVVSLDGRVIGSQRFVIGSRLTRQVGALTLPGLPL